MLFDQDSYARIIMDMKEDQKFNEVVKSIGYVIGSPNIREVYDAQVRELENVPTM